MQELGKLEKYAQAKYFIVVECAQFGRYDNRSRFSVFEPCQMYRVVVPIESNTFISCVTR